MHMSGTMIVEVYHYPRCVYAINGRHNAIILDALGIIYKASLPESPPRMVPLHIVL
jgi:hypothetical protein